MNLVKELADKDFAVKQLNIILENYKKEDFLFELYNIAIAQGFSTIAQKAELSRENLYKILKPNANPSWETLIKVILSMGFEFNLKKSYLKEDSKLLHIIKARRNSLAHTHSNLASEWNYIKNVSLSPNDVIPTSRKVVWWKCYKNHEWKEYIISRSKGKSCPYCDAMKVLDKLKD